jgi:uncharacterized protein YbbK (DUF523 family)
MRLVGDAENQRLIAPKSDTDHTERMKAWAQGRLDELATMNLSGFVAKKDSPSSGVFRVKVYNEHGMAQRTGMGIFPRELMNRFPLLPIEEEGGSTTCRYGRALSSGSLPTIAGPAC